MGDQETASATSTSETVRIMSGRYLALLALGAALVLVLGLVTRRYLAVRPEASRAPPSEAAALQELSQEAQLRRMNDFLAARAAEVAPVVAYVPHVGASGVRWSGDTVVTTLPGHPVIATLVAGSDAPASYAAIAPDSIRRGWVVIVGRTATGDVVTLSATSGGRAVTRCDAAALETFVLNVALTDPLAGAGVFTLAGRLLGIVAHCGERLIVVPAVDLERMLAR